MYNLRVLLIIFFSACFTALSAQEVLYSPYENFDFRSGDFSVIGKVGGKTYVYRSSSEGFFLDAFDDKMERQATVLLDFFPKKIYETRFIAYPDQIVVLYQSVQSNVVIQHAAVLDAAGRLKQNPIKLDEAKAGFFGPNKNYFSSAVSEDKKQILVYSANIKGSTLVFNGKFLNDQLAMLGNSTASYVADNDLDNGEGILTNDGTFFLPVYTPIGGKGYADQLWLLSLRNGERKFSPSELPLNQKFAAGTYMKLDNSRNRIYIAGFYSEKKAGNYEGILYAYYDIVSGSFESRKSIAFDQQLRNTADSRSARKAFNDFNVRNLIVKNDGGFVLVAEDYFVTTRNSYAPGYGYYSMYYPSMSSSVREYHYGDILALSYNSGGVREWQTFVRKNQYSQEDGGLFSSFAFMNTGGTLGFLFNDYNTNRSKIQLASVDGSGKLNMRSLAAGTADDPDWLPRSGKQIAAREVVIPCLRKRQICFAKIVF